ncbi:GntR family transcriptional regulator [Enterococcus sp. BWB1-3]|uniref:GntR family transcriptional regulator n=1 Tax=unclassified Enterococcus TaxID=2608891 RepID=UPI001921606E|nr:MULTISPECIES: GntR family transcriptional regulator [unclassified Enterococcus]MBL1229592.1 GntR family transcriptional regulator [Enterococcus sp. BWB1-3]MCB5951953.1 GntR family transcriptional regulator [Enterococcus sp. BWT-B8]MCB5954149.1 GntR family transcriptional regulator [Enterococcus sp. CWB-B31]
MKRKSVLYLEVAEQIKADILNGKYPVGSLLPTESELEELFEVSKITIRRAIEMLADEELVEKKSGKGTTVLSNRPYNKLSKAGTFTEYLHDSGLDIIKKNFDLELVTLSEDMEAYKGLGNSAVKFSRLYLLDSQPYIYFEYLLPRALSDVTVEQFETESLYRILDQHHIEIYRFEDSFEIIPLTPKLQKILNTAESSGLKRIRRSFGKNDQIVEFSEAVYNTAMHPYVIEYEA